ncbi:MAG: M24 family metallopeptidase [Bacillota bacterium]
MKIPKEELNRRKVEVVNYLEAEDLDGLLLTDPYNLFYMLDFFFVPTERPFYCLITRSGQVLVAAPNLEKEAGELEIVDDIFTYFDYPGRPDLYNWIIKSFKELEPGLKRIAVDTISLGLYQIFKKELESIENSKLIYKLRLTKTEVEAERLRTAAKYADFIVGVGAENVQTGISELELLDLMQSRTLQKMIAELDEIIYVPGGPCGGLVPFGKNTSLPHALPSNNRLQKGDALILSCGANYRGYRVESERSFFFGKPSDHLLEAFTVMKEAQALGLELIKPGVTCAEVDNQVLDFIRDAGYGEAIRHRTGHGKGLQEHEDPWVEGGDETVIQAGMVLSCEPGIYLEGDAGFRHSDTVLVTDSGVEVLTRFSKDIEDLILA